MYERANSADSSRTSASMNAVCRERFTPATAADCLYFKYFEGVVPVPAIFRPLIVVYSHTASIRSTAVFGNLNTWASAPNKLVQKLRLVFSRCIRNLTEETVPSVGWHTKSHTTEYQPAPNGHGGDKVRNCTLTSN